MPRRDDDGPRRDDGGRRQGRGDAPARTQHRLTPLGRRLANLPLDPRLGRMVLEAERRGCVREVMVIAAGLSIQDPRERPVDAREAADALHARFADPGSDFIGLLRLWNHVHEQQQALSTGRFRRLCRAEFLNYLRIREWQDLVGQLRQLSPSLGVDARGPRAGFDVEAAGDRDRIHVSLLSGLLSHLGTRVGTTQEYQGARGARFAVFPGSALFRSSPPWVMAAELVETSRLWARVVARVEPEWAEELAGDLVSRSYSEPRWDRGRGAVLATEKVTLYGLPIVPGRTVGYARVDPVAARELFIRHALVERDWETHHRFFARNGALLAKVEEIRDRVRRDVLVDDEILFTFFDQRVPASVVSARHFDSWWKQARRSEPELLDLTLDQLVDERAAAGEEDYPTEHHREGLTHRLSYRFRPGEAADGVTVHLPIATLNQVRGTGLDWQVPGLRLELVTALIRSLPKSLRRHSVPAPDHAAAVLDRLRPEDGPLLEVLARELSRVAGTEIPVDAWDLDKVPAHLRMTFRVEDSGGRTLAEGKDLGEVKRSLSHRMQAAISRAAASVEREGMRGWELESLPRTFEHVRDGQVLRGYPALVDTGKAVAVRVLGTEEEQRRSMVTGTRRLLLLEVPSPVAAVLARLDNRTKLALSRSPHGSATALFADCLACAVDAVVARNGGPAWDAEGFRVLVRRTRADLPEVTVDVVTRVAGILSAHHELEPRLAGAGNPALRAAVTDMREQVADLVFPGFAGQTGHDRLADVHRYLRGVAHRLDRFAENPARDAERMAQVHRVLDALDRLRDECIASGRSTQRVTELGWLVEELRISLFAQVLRAAVPVSEKRLLRAVEEARAAR